MMQFAPIETGDDLMNDLGGGFTSRVVRRHDNKIAVSGCGFGHKRALPLIPVPPAPEDEEDAARAGLDGHAHRRFLADFYAGDFPGSDAAGARFQPDPHSGEARTSGMAASLAGLDRALTEQIQ